MSDLTKKTMTSLYDRANELAWFETNWEKTIACADELSRIVKPGGPKPTSSEGFAKLPKYGSKPNDFSTAQFETPAPVYTVKGHVKYQSNSEPLVQLSVCSMGRIDKHMSWPVRITWNISLINISTQKETVIQEVTTVHKRPTSDEESYPDSFPGIKIPGSVLQSTGYEESTVNLRWGVHVDTLLAKIDTNRLLSAVSNLQSITKMFCENQDPAKEKIKVGLETERNMNLLVVGKTGNGKSALCNSLLMRGDVFLSMSSMTSVTTSVQLEYSEVFGRKLKVVDSPGVCDTKEGSDFILEAIKQAVAASPDGYHAILLVVKYGERFTAEERQAVDFLKTVFGHEFVDQFFIIVLTCGDKYKKDQKGKPLLQWCQSQEADHRFKGLVRECNQRVVIFDNTSDIGEEEKQLQVLRLVKMVESLRVQQRMYTNEEFEKAQEAREKLEIDAKHPKFREEVTKEISLINQKLGNMTLRNPSRQIEKLQKLLQRIEELLSYIQERDGRMNLFRDLVNSASRSRALANEYLEQAKTLKMEEEEARAKEREEQWKRDNEKRIQELEETLKRKNQEIEKERREKAAAENATILDKIVDTAAWGFKSVGKWFGY